MKDIITLAQVEDKVIEIRGQNVLLDSDVAALYGVETKEINQAVKNNPMKFPTGYIIQLEKDEWQILRSKILTCENVEPVTNCDRFEHQNLKSKILTSNRGNKEVVKIFDHPKLKFTPNIPKVFTERGLYMLATILKGNRAIQTSIAIVETFVKIRELTRTVSKLSETSDKSQQKSLMRKSGEIMSDLWGEGMKTTETESRFELNLTVFKLVHTVKRKND